MSRRFIIALLLALPFIAVGVVAYADWQSPPPCPNGGTCPPDNNLPGPVWLLPTTDTTTVQTGKLNISGAVVSNSVSTGAIGAVPASGDAVFGFTATPTYAAIHGRGSGDPTSITTPGSWAGMFEGYVYATQLCVGTTPGNCSLVGGSAGSLWSQETATNNIYKTTATGIVAIGSGTTPSTAGFPAGTKLAVQGDAGQGARIVVDQTTGNPEVDLNTSSTANDHWGLYVDKTSRDFRLWAKDTASGTGADRVSFTSQGVMVFGGWSAQAYTLTINSGGSGSTAGTVTSSPSGISCSLTGATASGTPPNGSCSTSISGGVTLTATPGASSAFGSFSSNCVGSGNQCTVTLTGNTTVTTTFTAPIPIVTTVAPSNVTDHGATAKGTVNPNNLSTSGIFSYRPHDGTHLTCDSNFFNVGASTNIFVPFNPSNTPALSGGSTPVAVSASNWQGNLSANTQYDYCAYATNSAGTGYSNQTTFTTVAAAPTVTSFNPSSGLVGASVTITGTNFTGATAVAFNGTGATFSVTNSTTISATVPAGASTGKVTVTNSVGPGTSAGNFTVTTPPAPTVTALNPGSGPVGTSVTITGTNFTGATTVTFGGTGATFSVTNSTTISTTVPVNASTGLVNVTTPNGNGNSPSNFTVTVPDTTPPTVSITAPAGGATVSGNATAVSATASDNVGVVGVQFKLDGVNLGAEDTTSPYGITWDTATASNGSHTLTAVARDAAANSTTSTGVTVTVTNTVPSLNTPTVTAITSSGATLGATVTSNGGPALTARGTCWSTSFANPTLANGTCLAEGSTTVGAFNQARSGMPASTLIHYSGYATNSVGTGYTTGDPTFTTSAPAASFTLTITHAVNRGTVSGSDGSQNVSCGLSCTTSSASFVQGHTITLTETDNTGAGWTFAGWINVTGGNTPMTCAEGSNDQPTCTFTMPGANQTVNAVFTLG